MNDLSKFILSSIVISYGSWFLSNMYVLVCAPPSLIGFLFSPIYIGTPVCRYIAFFQYELHNVYSQLWIAGGITLISKIKNNYNK